MDKYNRTVYQNLQLVLQMTLKDEGYFTITIKEISIITTMYSYKNYV